MIRRDDVSRIKCRVARSSSSSSVIVVVIFVDRRHGERCILRSLVSTNAIHLLDDDRDTIFAHDVGVAPRHAAVGLGVRFRDDEFRLVEYLVAVVDVDVQ
jgi:hypothetical protein